jgi:outer membrane protein FlgP
MKYRLLLIALLSATVTFAAQHKCPGNVEYNGQCGKVISECDKEPCKNSEYVEIIDVKDTEPEKVLTQQENVIISVVGQGVAPMNTISPAQAYALAKRAAVADAYRLIAEKVKGVRVDGQDLIKDMMVKRSTVRTAVQAMVRNSNIVETTYKEGLCEVEMEIVLYYSQFAQ